MKTLPFLRVSISPAPAAEHLARFSTIAVVLFAAALPVAVSPGDIGTIAGNGTQGYSGDGAAATAASLKDPMAVALDAANNLHLADLRNHCIRRVDDVAGAITTVAGTGMDGYDGDGIAATSAQLNWPFAIAFDRSGHLYIADSTNHRVRRVDKGTGIISTIVGTGTAGFGGDGGASAEAQLGGPTGVGFDGAGNLFIADQNNHRVRRIDAKSGKIITVAGTGMNGYGGDGGPATAAQLYYPYDLAFDSLGHLYVADPGNNRVRRVEFAGELPAPPMTVSKPRRFPATKVGRKSRPQLVTIRNAGSGPINGLGMSLAGRHRRDFIAKNPVPKLLAAGGSTRFPLTFRPRVPRLRHATLTVRSGKCGFRMRRIQGRGK